ncbi:MAG: 1-acyl-sn-glycerol-3-phosphate acyltransferase [Bacilli bacterium]|nr:1-acyl-sn-glycerol-3-phosphate acyltransferase [Bacilli bacterium]
MKILTYDEEKILSNFELIKYYEQLKEYLISTPHENLTIGSLTICEKSNPFVRKTLNRYKKYEIFTEGNENIDGLLGIYAHTHQSKMDNINFIATNPNHTILLNSAVLNKFYKIILRINGVVFVKKSDNNDKKRVKLELMRLLLLGKSITMFPESCWNCSPNKLHLPLYLGVVDMAKKTGVPIIPVTQEYTYDETRQDGIERIKSVYIKYGQPIYVSKTNNLFEKLEEYSEAISTMRWDLIKEKGQFQREDINNFQYINYLQGIIRNLKNAGISIDVERQGIYGANDDFYLSHYINDVKFDSKGEFIEPESIRKLTKII